jgi:hypothetical protein
MEPKVKPPVEAATPSRYVPNIVPSVLLTVPSMHLGDAAKWVIIVLCTTFLGLIAADETIDSWTFFSPSYLRDGFCVNNEGSKLLGGHAICFYADVSMALMMASLVHVGRKHVGLTEEALTPIAKNMV